MQHDSQLEQQLIGNDIDAHEARGSAPAPGKSVAAPRNTRRPALSRAVPHLRVRASAARLADHALQSFSLWIFCFNYRI